MRGIFSFDGPVTSFFSRFADLLWLNILYLICCIPVFTIGAATTALYYVALKMAKDEENSITKQFFKSFKDNFKQGTVIWLIFAVIIAILSTDLIVANRGSLWDIFHNNSVSNVVIVAVGVMAILIAITLTYVFPILAKFDNTIKNTIKNAFLISIRHLPYTVLFLLVNAAPWVIIILSGIYGNGSGNMLVFIQFSLTAYINARFFNKIFANYEPKVEVEDDPERIFTDEAKMVSSEG